MTKLLTVTLAASAAAALALTVAAPAHAASDTYEGAQVGLTYTVYEPSNTLGMPQSSFQLNGCAPGKDEQINSSYGRQGKARSIAMTQSQTGCEDGPDGVGKAATFTVDGATATVMGDCQGSTSTCAKATKAGVRRSAYTTVTLPSGGSGLGSTFVEVYSEGLSIAQIRTFVRGLKPAQ